MLHLKPFICRSIKIAEHIENLMIKCEVNMITLDTIQLALKIFSKYQYNYYDCLIIASALENGCAILYSEDMQHKQIIDKKLLILNPFLK